jgi:hypothetical protein
MVRASMYSVIQTHFPNGFTGSTHCLRARVPSRITQINGDRAIGTPLPVTSTHASPVVPIQTPVIPTRRYPSLARLATPTASRLYPRRKSPS